MPIEAFRAQQVTISVPRHDSIPFITLLLERLEVNESGEILAATARQDMVYRNAHEVNAETVTFYDPVTQTDSQISVAGLDAAIRAIANRWTAEDLGGEIGLSGYTEIRS